MAMENFPFPYRKVDLDLIKAIAEIKMAAARANLFEGSLELSIAKAIEQACQEIIEGQLDEQFPTVALQGGAGTSINMNVNEVGASRATEILKAKKIEAKVHPNDHVNKSQSTNDVNPSALKIVCLRLVTNIENSLDGLIKTFDRKAEEFAEVKKLARTHIQDAVPTTLGAEMEAYSVILQRDKKRLKDLYEFLSDLNLGGTAIGNKINASEVYIKQVYKELTYITGLKLEPADNFMSLTSSQSDFCHVSGLVTILAGDLSKIAKDLRFMASGPNGGIGEITLENLQPGSSIMPGKVNPVIPEAVDQVFYFIAGKNATIQKASEDAHLELGIMFPILADSLINILKLIDSAIQVFDSKCISTLKVNPEKCLQHLETSTAYATLLTPVLGYDKVSKIVKKSVNQNKSIREIVLEEGLLSESEFEQAVKV